jgi:undecaprenyl diphosphate synthase
MSVFSGNFEGIIQPGSRESDLLEKIDPDRLPRHLAIIMDGNGRWAKQRGLPRVEGHRAGIEAVRASLEYSARLEIPALTLYAFSAENWKRPADEVSTLWALLRRYLRSELKTLQKHSIRFTPIGRIDELPSRVREALVRAQDETRNNGRMDLAIALNYSGRLEIVDAANRFISSGADRPMNEHDVSRNLYTSQLPDLDLLVRTSGEMRLSNFLLWQVAYSEIHVSPVLWPDFRGIDLLQAIVEFQQRERRYGGITTKVKQGTR